MSLDDDRKTNAGQEPADLAEAALGITPEQSERYQKVIDGLLQGRYFSLDEEGKVSGWNADAEAQFGWPAHEILGEDFFEFLAPLEEGDDLRELILPILNGEDQQGTPGRQAKMATRRRDSSKMVTEVSLIPIRVGDGYRLNWLLKDIATHRGNPVEHHRMKKRHAEVLTLIIDALDGGEMPPPLDDDGWRPNGKRVEERWLPAGALVIFVADAQGAAAAKAAAASEGSGSPRMRAAALGELDDLREENQQLRKKLRDAQEQVEKLREELDDVRTGVVGRRAKASALADPSISPAHIQRALREDGFTLHCQPVLDLNSGEIAQHEVLLRMVAPDGALLLPHTFLGTARRAGLLAAIDQWVVRRAIRTIGEQAQVGRDVCLEVNLSAEALHDASLIPAIEGEVARTGIEPNRLVLEVPEQVAITDPDGARSLAKQLRAIGCSFGLDDFGSSFGSFRFLKDLPVDYLKLDGDLIVTLSESRTAQLVVKALVDVANGTGAETIAVFASDDDTLRLLRELGVGFAQGHRVGRPRPIGEALSEVDVQGLRPVETAEPVQRLAGASGTRKRAK
ncbi:MAG: EAL domain-containing protein [Actinobacteria bacterium]|nr:EAL domain-containing protein [Actinomycetota bacterium]